MPRHLGDDWLLPGLDHLSRPWFTSGKIVVQKCEGCGQFQHPPDEVCGSCQGSEFGWCECSGEGRVESVAVVHHALRPSLKAHVPYAVVVVSLDDVPGAHAIGNVLGTPASDVAIGQRVRAVFEEFEDTEAGETLQIPQWEVV